MKGALEELNEETEGLETVSKLQTQILNLTDNQVNILDDLDPTKFKSTYTILEQISQVWYDMNQIEQSQLLELIAGKNRANEAAAIIQAFASGQVQKAYQTSMNSEGSAMEEHARWMESIDAKIAQFQAAFQSLSETVVSSDLIKFFVDLGTSSISTLDTIIDKVGTLPALITTTAGAMSAFKNVGRPIDYVQAA